MKTKLILAVIMAVLALNTGCVLYDGTYRGRVIDAETREPIKDVVALGTWYKVHGSLAGGWSEYYDARETLTDKDGDFVIPGQGFNVLSGLDTMHILVFKAGYSFESGPWGAFKHPSAADQFKWEGDKLIIPLKKLTMEERKKGYGPPMEAPEKKMPLMLKEINIDRIERGLKPIDWGGK